MTKLSQETIDGIYAYLDEGISFNEISKKLDISASTVSTYCKMRILNLTILNDVVRMNPNNAQYNPELVELHQSMEHYEKNGTFESFEFDIWNKYFNSLIWLPNETDTKQIEELDILYNGNWRERLYEIPNVTSDNELRSNLARNGLIERIGSTSSRFNGVGLRNKKTTYQKTSLGIELTDHLMDTVFSNQ